MDRLRAKSLALALVVLAVAPGCSGSKVAHTDKAACERAKKVLADVADTIADVQSGHASHRELRDLFGKAAKQLREASDAAPTRVLALAIGDDANLMTRIEGANNPGSVGQQEWSSRSACADAGFP